MSSSRSPGGLPPHPRRRRTTLGSLGLIALAACTSAPRAQPLDPRGLLAAVRAERVREPARATIALTLDEATRRLRTHNPDVREAHAALDAARRVAAVPTPRANPTIGLGALLLGEDDILRGISWGIEAAIGWIVPLAPTRCLQDALHAVEAEAAFARAAATERSVYLALRREFVAGALAAARVTAQRDLAAAAEASVRAAEGLLEAGEVSGVDLRLLQLDAARAQAEVLTAEEADEEARQAVAARIGLAPGAWIAPVLPPLPASIPSLIELEDGAARGHPALDVLRAEYLVAEKALRLEAASAVPSLELGLEYEREDAPRLGLPLGIEIPIFDRGQVGVTRALAARDTARARYRAELSRRLAEIAAARARVASRTRRLHRLESLVAPEAARALDLTRAALEGGATDALRYLEVLRTARDVRLEIHDARTELYDAWSDLESAAGVPLLAFPDATPSVATDVEVTR